MPIEDLGKFVGREKHLPNMTNASEINEKGLNLGVFQRGGGVSLKLTALRQSLKPQAGRSQAMCCMALTNSLPDIGGGMGFPSSS
jgi:hypothetical protein